MPWWSWRPGHVGGSEPDTRSRISEEGTVRVGPPAPREPEDDCAPIDRCAIKDMKDMPATVAPVTLRRVGDALDLLDVRYLADGDGSLLAMWERHAVLFTLEGPEDEILVMRARPHATVPPDWADRAYRVVNEWNHTRRFCKAYVGDPTERGQLPIYAELQVPLGAGAHDALLVEMLDCGAAVATTFVDWLHDEGALL
ncbi:YbjN domain-containing protein [Micromonospora echinofusca]|uniref:YbjN domain-containing protein n=1 Tax=Micromonospora echinofusca TaxID=47858 RepID=A0ABS3VVD0_MICEH|nr:YbjN domain-containing protein [Micromonospora echinofusca]MBO4208354.1 YbjN domain-containing protein [Micromonospora echinofusca]